MIRVRIVFSSVRSTSLFVHQTQRSAGKAREHACITAQSVTLLQPAGTRVRKS
jgi:cellobiose-specific phosphotransferase system component IIB